MYLLDVVCNICTLTWQALITFEQESVTPENLCSIHKSIDGISKRSENIQIQQVQQNLIECKEDGLGVSGEKWKRCQTKWE